MEGTTQGDPLSMAIYALGTFPLISRAQQVLRDAIQSWYADDAGAGGRLQSLYSWWMTLTTDGPSFGYYVNPPKTWLLVKDEHLEEAQNLFGSTGINITTEGRPVLGSPCGEEGYCEDYCKTSVKKWVSKVSTLAKFAKTQPHAAFAAFTHGLSSEWIYLSRSFPSLDQHLQPLEDVIRQEFLPALTGRAVSDLERNLLSLPARLGGMALGNPASDAIPHFNQASTVIDPMVRLICGDETGTDDEASFMNALAMQHEALTKARKSQAEALAVKADRIYRQLDQRGQRAMTLAQERGASIWLTAIPVDEHSFALSRSDFRDALCLRYGWTPAHLPSHCSDGEAFTVEHALSCSRGGYVALRHNEVRDLLTDLLSDSSCHNVSAEPHLQPVRGEQLSSRAAIVDDEARLDIKAGGFWGRRHELAFFDVRVFNPHASSYRAQSLSQVYRKHESEKRRQYGERVKEIERGSFTPLVFSATGGAGPAATVFLKRLGELVSEQHDMPYSQAMAWLRCRLSFALLRSAILCLRGTRQRKAHDSPNRESLEPSSALATSHAIV